MNKKGCLWLELGVGGWRWGIEFYRLPARALSSCLHGATDWVYRAAMAYSGKAVANEFLALAKEDGMELSNMKLQKLLYFAHGWHLAQFGKPLLKDTVEAWKFGPVVADIYHEFKGFGNGSIKKSAVRIGDDGSFVAPRITRSDTITTEFLHTIWDSYKDFTGVQLSNMTHVEDGPWHIAWYDEGGQYRSGKDINDRTIKEYFCKQMQLAKDSE